MTPARIIVIALALGLALNSLFVVSEGERAVVTRFSKLIEKDGEARVFAPGLHFKVPAIDTVRHLDARIQTLDGQPDRFVTSEKKDLLVDSFVKWRIADFRKFFLATNGGNKQNAEALLQSKINNGLRSEFGSRTIKDIVSGSRDELQQEALSSASESAEDLGIQVVDVRVKQINLPREVSNSIFQRMRAERQAVAKEHRSKGREKAEVIRAEIDAQITVMIADAQRSALTTRGQGDAESAAIYAGAYKKDEEFFSFLRSIDAYQEAFNSKNDVMLVSPDGDFFRFMKDSRGDKPAAQ
ncbi:protease modulator HflC [Paraferrimonas sedimenticola]|uniref:Protein HflC n=1 Tax=Paraferrimonas sedimenticola TaxID=375674 RepID=A0AA37RUV5_9GAMM|nr:protease modulator HflC [Paraferrimonas sedimenticola]GLP95736.1 protein HflC [Paraferrimonas sedimenticola]